MEKFQNFKFLNIIKNLLFLTEDLVFYYPENVFLQINFL